ncbi:MAG: ferric reductase-like transmembrane domain-containing protein [Pseudomonadota bacterium]
MKPDLKLFYGTTAFIIFIGLPVFFYATGDFPRRSFVKEAISLLTLLAFTLMLGQFFLARSNMDVIRQFKMRNIQTLHKYIAYGAAAIILLHPVLIVLPRAFEGGIAPWDAFLMMLMTVDSLGVVLGLIAWVLLLILTLTAVFRMHLIKTYHIPYRNWRYFHGFISVAFVTAGLVHAIELGRHTTILIAGLMISLAVVGTALLFRLYAMGQSAPARSPKPAGAS